VITLIMSGSDRILRSLSARMSYVRLILKADVQEKVITGNYLSQSGHSVDTKNGTHSANFVITNHDAMVSSSCGLAIPYPWA